MLLKEWCEECRSEPGLNNPSRLDDLSGLFGVRSGAATHVRRPAATPVLQPAATHIRWLAATHVRGPNMFGDQRPILAGILPQAASVRRGCSDSSVIDALFLITMNSLTTAVRNEV